MNNQAPIRQPAGNVWSTSWEQWFQTVFNCLRWNKSFNYTATIDFTSVAANAQSAASTVSIPGVRQGDAVAVTPLADTAGILYKALVTADNTVSVYACNFTAGAIDPASTTFRIIVLQN